MIIHLMKDKFIDKNGNLAAAKIAVISAETKSIIKAETKCLDIFKDISISDRIRFILNPVKIQSCKKCKKLWIEFPGKYGHLYQNCRCRKHGVKSLKKSNKFGCLYNQAKLDIIDKCYNKKDEFKLLVKKLNIQLNYGYQILEIS